MNRINRNLDGVYETVYRGNCFQKVCLLDMTTAELTKTLVGKDIARLIRAVCELAGSLRWLGDKFDINSGMMFRDGRLVNAGRGSEVE